MADARLNIGVSADAKQASATFKSLSEDIKKVGTESVGVTEAVGKASAAFDKLAKAPDTVGSLATATAKAKLAVDELRAALEKTPATGENYQKLADALKQAEEAMERTVQRAANLRKAQEDVNKQIGITSGNVKEMVGQYGNLGSVTDKLAGSTNTFVGAIGKAGLVGMAMAETWKVAKGIGEGLATQIDKLAAKLDAKAKAANDAKVRAIELEQALRLVERGTIAMGRSTNEMLANYRAYIAAMKEARQPTLDAARAADEYAMAIGRLDEIVGRAKGRGFTILSPEDAKEQQAAADALARGLNDALGKALRDGGEAGLQEWAEANKKAIEQVIGYYKDFPEQAPEYVRLAYEKMRGAVEGGNPLAPFLDEYQGLIDKQKEWLAETERVETGMRKWTEATQGASSAFGALSGDFTQINGAVQDFLSQGGQLKDLQVGMSEVAMTWQRSTAAMNEELERQLDLMGRLDQKMVETLDKYEQWRSAIATAVSALKDGTTSSAGFIQIMNSLATQLSQNFGAAAGEAGDEVRKLIGVIQALIATATTGGQTNIDPTLWGGLEREFGKGKK